MSPEFDLIIIGAGSAGYNGAALAHKMGLKVGLIDGAEELGGLCILRGCMPSKALLAGAQRFQQVRESGEFGISVENATINMAELMARKDRWIGEFADYRRGQIMSGRFPFIHGYTAFVDERTVEITTGPEAGRRVTASYFLVATGSELKPPTLPGLMETGFQHSDTLLKNPHVPASVIVLGAGAIGLEFAHYYNALGSRVTILQRSAHLLRGSDFQVSDALRKALEKRGIKIHTGVTLESAGRDANGKKVAYSQGDARQEIEAEEIFYALGRRPKLDTLGLEKAGVQAGLIRPTQQTNQDHIFSAGDVAGPYEIVHLAIQQAEVAVRNVIRLLKNDSSLEVMDYRSKLFVLFTHPELAQIGLTEEEAREKDLDVLIACHPFDDHGKSLVMGESDGFVKLIALRNSGEIIGASVFGPEASSLIHEIVAVMHFHGTAADIAKMPHYHPTLAEIWTYPAEEIADQVA